MDETVLFLIIKKMIADCLFIRNEGSSKVNEEDFQRLMFMEIN